MLRGLADRLRSRASRSDRRRRAGALALVLAAGILAILIWALLPDFQIRLDPAMLLFGLAACILAWSLYLAASRPGSRGAQVVVVTYDLRLSQPTLPGGRYRFELTVWSEVALQGRRERRRQAHVELVFRKGDHPEVLAWCNTRVERYLRAHRRLAERLYPEATVVLAPMLGRRRLLRSRACREPRAPRPELHPAPAPGPLPRPALTEETP